MVVRQNRREEITRLNFASPMLTIEHCDFCHSGGEGHSMKTLFQHALVYFPFFSGSEDDFEFNLPDTAGRPSLF